MQISDENSAWVRETRERVSTPTKHRNKRKEKLNINNGTKQIRDSQDRGDDVATFAWHQNLQTVMLIRKVNICNKIMNVSEI